MLTVLSAANLPSSRSLEIPTTTSPDLKIEQASGQEIHHIFRKTVYNKYHSM